MAKKLQVVLTQSVAKLGQDGDVVDVAPGYARNYLIPQGKGVMATRGVLKQVALKKEKERQRLLALKEVAMGQKATLESAGVLSIAKQVGENEAIFGTVTTQDVADAITAKTGLEIDRRGITVPEIGHLGVYTAHAKLHPEVTAEVPFKVVSL
ncbi:MAG: 50S ribosomal protein L9 [Chroococcopsis gigantea SAG 12.99]|jgi:large subunit ribosomal protein L9|nr:50S ribosomal protein L9 [Chlorogloea purpurea SAG 13.99]MDV3001620.1 50S ribosomal protein L9 [Chroococcopsis gigantea SAG 12.99]